MAYIEKETNRKVGKAIHGYKLLEDGDRILVAVSGGADSLVMLKFLCAWRKKAPIDFGLFPVYLEMGYNRDTTWPRLLDFFSSLNLPFYMEETGYAIYAHGVKNRGKSPCFLCSWKRRKRLFELTQVFGCNKIALGHNLDDLIETLFLNMCYSGEMSTMLPRQEMFKGLITIARPLALVEKDKIKRLAKLWMLPACRNRCPSAKESKRASIRQLLNRLYEKDAKIKGNLARALFNTRPEYLPQVLPQIL